MKKAKWVRKKKSGAEKHCKYLENHLRNISAVLDCVAEKGNWTVALAPDGQYIAVSPNGSVSIGFQIPRELMVKKPWLSEKLNQMSNHANNS